MTEITIGVGVSKDTLDVHLHPAGSDRQFPNTPKGFSAIIMLERQNRTVSR